MQWWQAGQLYSATDGYGHVIHTEHGILGGVVLLIMLAALQSSNAADAGTLEDVFIQKSNGAAGCSFERIKCE